MILGPWSGVSRRASSISLYFVTDVSNGQQRDPVTMCQPFCVVLCPLRLPLSAPPSFPGSPDQLPRPASGSSASSICDSGLSPCGQLSRSWVRPALSTPPARVNTQYTQGHTCKSMIALPTTTVLLCYPSPPPPGGCAWQGSLIAPVVRMRPPRTTHED